MEMVRTARGCGVGTNNNFCTARHDGEVGGGCNGEAREREKKTLGQRGIRPESGRKGSDDHRVHDESRCQIERVIWRIW